MLGKRGANSQVHEGLSDCLKGPPAGIKTHPAAEAGSYRLRRTDD